MAVPLEMMQMFLPASHTIYTHYPNTSKVKAGTLSLKSAWYIQLGYTASQSETPPCFLLFLKYREHTQTKLNQSPIYLSHNRKEKLKKKFQVFLIFPEYYGS